MKTEINFHDPFFTSSVLYEENGLRSFYPLVGKDCIKECSHSIRLNAEKYFSSHSAQEIQSVFDAVDSSFVDVSSTENIKLVDLIQRSSGFSRYDIEHWGLGLFKSIANYNTDKRGYYVNLAVKEKGIIRTDNGYLKRFGLINPFNRWKEPSLISHFISGNVVGYTAILSRIGLPLKSKGSAQILKLPSSASVFPMVYLDKLQAADPELRRTIACGYWKGGDNSIEKPLIEESDAINILSSDESINDLQSRVQKYHRGLTLLTHGHKVGIAYINDEDKLEQTLTGLVTDISAFDGGACYNVKNIFVQGDPKIFAERLFEKLERFAEEISEVSENSKSIGRSLYRVYTGSDNVISSEKKSVLVRFRKDPEFWMPDESYRYVQVMKVKDEKEVFSLIKNQRHFLQTAIIAVPDEKIIPVFLLFGNAGVSNIHYPGSAPLINVYEEPHDGEFDALRVRYNYSSRFAALNFKNNNDWLN